MRMSPAGRKALIGREGLRLKAYKDTKGIPTIGVGHTGPEVHMGLEITPAEAEDILARDLAKFEACVNSSVDVSLDQNEFDALCSLAFNIGVGAFKVSTVVRKLNAGDRAGAAKAILLWNKPPEIMGRRRGEYDQFVGNKPNGGRMVLQPKAAKKAGAATGLGLMGTGLSDAASQIAPLTDISDILKYVFIALTLAGIAYGLWKWWKE